MESFFVYFIILSEFFITKLNRFFVVQCFTFIVPQ